MARVHAAPELGQWVPLFQGIDHVSGTNSTRSGDFENLMVINALRIDLRDPDIRFLSSPRISNYVANVRETAGRTVSQFLRTNQVQVAVNAGFFNPGTYYLPEGTPMTAAGLLISQGELVSPASASYFASLLIDQNNQARIVPTNWPAVSTDGVWTAVSGDYPVLVGGVNVGRNYRNLGGFVHDNQPRTAIGLSEDRRDLFLLVIDGRQPGYSNGAYDSETAAWLQLLGAHDGINMDGGGSTTMVVEGSTGNPVRLNRSSAVADSGKERTVGSHLGVFAKPVTGFINEVVALPDDDVATITWTTRAPATTQVEYGLTSDLGLTTPTEAAATTNHAIRLTGLIPGTGYYFRAVSEAGGTTYTSTIRFFATTNYLSTNLVIALTDSWKYSFANLDGVAWTELDFDDSNWSGPGAGVLWADTRGSLNPEIQPEGDPLPGNGEFPYFTYYFRTHFQSVNPGPGSQLQFFGFIDDGAVVYLNGHEIYRLRMEDPPAVVSNESLAAGYPCDGDAICPDEFVVADSVAEHLREGDNVLAVEVHNYNARSPDITFGLAVTDARTVTVPAVLAISGGDGTTSVSWTRGGFVLQWSEGAQGPWTDVPGPVLASPFTVSDAGSTRYYRLRK
ncbi:MAG TPA: phosphodiester glycosidase family protein [Verrucomicrobiota bacterium]|nr:phosphodiester glycosidase family protein [Verrucomicrobiota bacterium]